MRTRIEAARGHASKPPGIKPYNMRTMTDTDLMDTTLDFRHSVSAHAPATVEADGQAGFVAPALGIQHGPAAEHSSETAGAGPASGARDDTLPKRAFISFTSTDSGLSECQTPIAPTQRPSAASKVRSVVRYEDILDELHVAVRLREAPLPRGQKLQSSWD